MKREKKEKVRKVIFFALICISFILGYTLGNFQIFSHSTEFTDKFDESLKYLLEAKSLIEDGRYIEAMNMLNESKIAIYDFEEHIRPYNMEVRYLKCLTFCIEDLIDAMNNPSIEKIKRLNESLGDFLKIADEIQEYPEVAEKLEKLGADRIIAELKSLRYDIMDYYMEEAAKHEQHISLEGFIKEYKWKDHLGKEWRLIVKVSERRYEKYKNATHEIGKEINFVTDDDYLIRDIAEFFDHTYIDEEDKANCVLSFVQKSIPSIPEETEYFKYPIETLVEGGDCEDKSILFVTIMKILGYDTAFITFPYHEIAGISLSEIKEVENPLYFTPSYLFNMELEFEEELNSEDIPRLMREFENNSFTLDKNASIKKEEREDEHKWKIISGKEKYMVMKRGDKLEVYYDPFSEKRKYYACETFEESFLVGELPDEYKGMKYSVICVPRM